jgi:hypothetical protein
MIHEQMVSSVDHGNGIKPILTKNYNHYMESSDKDEKIVVIYLIQCRHESGNKTTFTCYTWHFWTASFLSLHEVPNESRQEQNRSQWSSSSQFAYITNQSTPWSCPWQASKPAYITGTFPQPIQFNPDDGDMMFLHNTAICLRDYTVLQPTIWMRKNTYWVMFPTAHSTVNDETILCITRSDKCTI